MAFNWQTFKTRATTAVIFVAIMLAGLLWNHWSFFILFSVIHLGCWLEYLRLMGLIHPAYAAVSAFHKNGIILAGWCAMLFATNHSFAIGSLSLHAIGWWMGLVLLFVLPIAELLFTNHIDIKNIQYSFLGFLYISISWALLIDLRNPDALNLNWITPMVLIASIWINDTMAYIVGSLIGKTPLSTISPKKTWEGTAGGAILAILVVGFGLHFIFNTWQPSYFIIPAIAAIAGTAGDLLESKLKRLAGVKDSGSLMPGHGGFLDRFDSLLIAIPFVWIYIKWISQ